MTRENRYDSIKGMHSQVCEHLCTHNKRFEKGEKASVHAECIHIYGRERILPRHNKSVKEETMKRVTPLFVLSLTGCLRVASPFSSCTSVYEPLAVSSADGPHHVSDSMLVVPRSAIVSSISPPRPRGGSPGVLWCRPARSGPGSAPRAPDRSDPAARASRWLAC